MFSTHIYPGGPETTEQQQARSAFANDVALVSSFHNSGPYEIFVSEYSLAFHGAGDGRDPFDYAGLASWFVHQLNQQGAGSMLWNFDGAGAWGPVSHSVGSAGAVPWAAIFAD